MSAKNGTKVISRIMLSVASSRAPAPLGGRSAADSLCDRTLLVLFSCRHSCWLEGNGRRAQLPITSSPSMPRTYRGVERILLESWGTEDFKREPFIHPNAANPRGASWKCWGGFFFFFLAVFYRSNLMGTKFTVFDNALNPERALPDMSNARQELAGIIYVSHYLT